MNDLKKIIDEVKKCSSDDFKPSDDAILNCSTKILLSNPVNKKHTQGHNPNIKINDPDSPITPFQKKKLVDMNLEGLDPEKIPELTKGEAHRLIAENLNKKPTAPAKPEEPAKTKPEEPKEVKEQAEASADDY